MLQMVHLKIPKVLLERIDKFKEKKGFNTRTNAIIHLIITGLDLEKD